MSPPGWPSSPAPRSLKELPLRIERPLIAPALRCRFCFLHPYLDVYKRFTVCCLKCLISWKVLCLIRSVIPRPIRINSCDPLRSITHSSTFFVPLNCCVDADGSSFIPTWCPCSYIQFLVVVVGSLVGLIIFGTVELQFIAFWISGGLFLLPACYELM